MFIENAGTSTITSRDLFACAISRIALSGVGSTWKLRTCSILVTVLVFHSVVVSVLVLVSVLVAVIVLVCVFVVVFVFHAVVVCVFVAHLVVVCVVVFVRVFVVVAVVVVVWVSVFVWVVVLSMVVVAVFVCVSFVVLHSVSVFVSVGVSGVWVRFRIAVVASEPMIRPMSMYAAFTTVTRFFNSMAYWISVPHVGRCGVKNRVLKRRTPHPVGASYWR